MRCSQTLKGLGSGVRHQRWRKLRSSRCVKSNTYFLKQDTYLFCPSLMTGVWRKQSGKIADTQFCLPQGSTHWPEDMFEPLTIALLKPLLSCRPWKAGRTTFVEKLKKDVHGVFCNGSETLRDHMRKFWSQKQCRRCTLWSMTCHLFLPTSKGQVPSVGSEKSIKCVGQ